MRMHMMTKQQFLLVLLTFFCALMAVVVVGIVGKTTVDRFQCRTQNQDPLPTFQVRLFSVVLSNLIFHMTSTLHR